MSKIQFLETYRRLIVETYGHEWAADAAKLNRFMESAKRTITTTAATWNHNSPTVNAAWRAIGGKGKATLKGLRALPVKSVYDIPCAANGLVSYRYPGSHGWIMIGARDHADALREADRSLSYGKAELSRLQVWNNETGYQPVV